MLFLAFSPVVTVEKYHSAPISAGNRVKKRKLYLPPPPGESAAPQGVVEGVFGCPLGPLPTGLLKPSKVLVTNPRDRGREVERKIRNLRRSKVPPLTGRIGNSQRSATQPLGSVEQGGLQPSCSSTNNCAPPGGVAVTVLRDNLCYNKRLR